MKIKKINPFIGLMFKKDIDHAVYFKARLGIHTFFMRFPIDVVLVDDQKQIVATKQNLKPWRIWLWGLKEYTVVELPSQLQPRRLELSIEENFNKLEQ